MCSLCDSGDGRFSRSCLRMHASSNQKSPKENSFLSRANARTDRFRGLKRRFEPSRLRRTLYLLRKSRPTCDHRENRTEKVQDTTDRFFGQRIFGCHRPSVRLYHRGRGSSFQFQPLHEDTASFRAFSSASAPVIQKTEFHFRFSTSVEQRRTVLQTGVFREDLKVIFYIDYF